MNRLIKKLPQYYHKSKVANDLLSTIQEELDLFDKRINETLNQFFIINSTTHIARHEKELGIKVDESKDINYRRSVILAKRRGASTTTIEMIKNVARSYTNGEVEVIEDSEHYTFTIKFISILGIPPNIDDFKNAIEEIKPAHLKCLYEFSYMTWNDIDSYNLTWNKLDSLDLTWDEFEIYKKEGVYNAKC